MSLIDTSYFVREINVPISSNVALNSALTESISAYEEEALKLLLGYKLYKEMKTAVDAYDAAMLTYDPEGEEAEPVLEERWDKLINGDEFTFDLNGETIEEKWIGLKNASKVSLIANYVYFMYRRNNASQFNGQAETVGVSENSTPVSPRHKLVGAWNKFVDLFGDTEGCYETMPLLASDYRHINAYPSAYNYLLANASSYSGWKFAPQHKMNIWGL